LVSNPFVSSFSSLTNIAIDNQDLILKEKNNKSLMTSFKTANVLMEEVRNTSDATVDSRYLLDATDLASKKVHNDAYGSASLGLDVDVLLSRCKAFMRDVGSSSTSQNRSRRASPDDDDDMDGNGIDWSLLGLDGAYAGNLRSAAPAFMLGPLAVEKKVRATQRTTRNQRQDPHVDQVKPQELQASDLQQSENSSVTKMCAGIKQRLEELLQERGDSLESDLRKKGFQDTDDLMSEVNPRWSLTDLEALFSQHGLKHNYAISLFEFAVNPSSFGQTVENFFYISFLVRDGYIAIESDNHGLPTVRK
jgi:hypothetical protein